MNLEQIREDKRKGSRENTTKQSECIEESQAIIRLVNAAVERN